MKVLHVAAEVFPLVKTGGLADVVAALPVALAAKGADVRLMLPGLPAVMEGVQHANTVIDIGSSFGALRVRLLLARMPGSHLPVYVVDAPYLYRRGGGPYQSADGIEWPDNLQRFALLGWVAAHVAGGDADPQWVPDIVHAHDWHAAMACAYMADHVPTEGSSIFTIHNLAFQGLFPLHDWPLLGLVSRHMSPAGMEFHGQLNFMKAGLQFADRITTVSPTYAREIATHEFGHGLDGVIRSRRAQVSGILNGIDEDVWNPARDPAIAASFDSDRLQGKSICRRALQTELGLAETDDALVLVVVSRLTAQKGMDLLLAALPELVSQGVQIVVQGTGEPALETMLQAAHASHPRQVHVHIGYDEARAHRLIAGADVIAVPSRFEPCGLTQMYGLRYGSMPVVRRVGGLADTVIDDAGPTDLRSTGFVFETPSAAALAHAVLRARRAKSDPEHWRGLMLRAMRQPLSWANPADQYLQLYASARNEHASRLSRA